MIVAYFIPHNEGIETGIITKAGQTTADALIDLSEVDGVITSFETLDEARAWIKSRLDDSKVTDFDMEKWRMEDNDGLEWYDVASAELEMSADETVQTLLNPVSKQTLRRLADAQGYEVEMLVDASRKELIEALAADMTVHEVKQWLGWDH
jgi:hypothetical protein